METGTRSCLTILLSSRYSSRGRLSPPKQKTELNGKVSVTHCRRVVQNHFAVFIGPLASAHLAALLLVVVK